MSTHTKKDTKSINAQLYYWYKTKAAKNNWQTTHARCTVKSFYAVSKPKQVSK